MKEFFNLLKANGMIMNLVFFMAVAFMLGAAAGVATANDKTKRLPTFGSLFVLGSGWNKIY